MFWSLVICLGLIAIFMLILILFALILSNRVNEKQWDYEENKKRICHH